jgi:hypothetical protein
LTGENRDPCAVVCEERFGDVLDDQLRGGHVRYPSVLHPVPNGRSRS